MDFLDSLPILLQSFWYIALPTSLIFVLQTLLTFTGADATDGLDADFDGDLGGEAGPFQLFSLRNLINFLLGFSWTGICFYDQIPNENILIAVALGVGILFVWVFFMIINQVKKLAEDNSFSLQNTLYQTAEVYLPIPENKSGKGKVHIHVNGSLKELDAISLDIRFEAGTLVKIIDIQKPDLLIVKAL